MQFYDGNIVKKVQEKRKSESLGIKKLSRLFGVPDTTISRWVRSIPIGSKSFSNARKKETEDKRQYIGAAKSIPVNEETAKILCALLYWCEGSKYPASNGVIFSNSDAHLVKTFLYLLRNGFTIDDHKLRAHLQLHTTHDVATTTAFWSKELHIPKTQFYKPTVTRPTRTMKREGYQGTCTVKYYDAKLLLGIMGLYREFSDILSARRGG